MILTGKNQNPQRKTCPSATLSTTNPIRTDPGANPGLSGDRPVTNRSRLVMIVTSSQIWHITVPHSINGYFIPNANNPASS
jgi:hypothetical protein